MIPDFMRAAVLHGAYDLRVEDVPVPKLGPSDALIRIRSCGVCASDVHFYTDGRIGTCILEKPMIVGHEAAGEVAAIGPEVRGLAVGTRVALEPGVACGTCSSCKSGRYNLCPDVVFYATPPVDGAMSEYAVIRSDFAHPLPDHVTFDQGALCEPLAVGIHCCERAGVRPGDTVAVLGAGPIGLAATVAARNAGARMVVVSDVFPLRLDVARRLGAVAVDVRTDDLLSIVMDLTNGEGVTACIDTSGNRAAIEAAPDLVRRGGSIVVVGLPADDAVTHHVLKIVDRELSIHGSFRYCNAYPAAVALVASGMWPVAEIITDRISLQAAEEAFERALHQKERTIKVIVEM